MNYYLKRVILALTGWIPDEPYVKIIYYLQLKEKLNLKEPKSFPEKITWLKLYDLKPLYMQLADKVEARKVVAERIGEQYLIKQYGAYDSVDDIPYDSFPKKYVLKCTHDSGSTIICKDNATFDRVSANKFFSKRLKLKFYLEGRENVYKNVKPQVVCEEFLGDTDNVPEDYKVFCFDGKPEFIQVDVDRYTNHTQYFYDTDWNRIYMASGYEPAKDGQLKRPELLPELLEVAKKMSQGIKFVRADFYIVGGKIYFGEMTFYPGAGLQHFSPKEIDDKYANMIHLDK